MFWLQVVARARRRAGHRAGGRWPGRLARRAAARIARPLGCPDDRDVRRRGRRRRCGSASGFAATGWTRSTMCSTCWPTSWHAATRRSPRLRAQRHPAPTRRGRTRPMGELRGEISTDVDHRSGSGRSPRTGEPGPSGSRSPRAAARRRRARRARGSAGRGVDRVGRVGFLDVMIDRGLGIRRTGSTCGTSVGSSAGTAGFVIEPLGGRGSRIVWWERIDLPFGRARAARPGRWSRRRSGWTLQRSLRKLAAVASCQATGTMSAVGRHRAGSRRSAAVPVGRSARPTTSRTTTTSGAGPVRDDQGMFERLTLEAFQSGLSWITILRKRPAFRAAFDGFDPAVVAGVRTTTTSSGCWPTRGSSATGPRSSPRSTTRGPRSRCPDGLAALAWSYAPSEPRPAPRRSRGRPGRPRPSRSRWPRAARSRGFRFVGPTTAYALMQAVGMVDDHLAGCIARRSGQRPLNTGALLGEEAGTAARWSAVPPVRAMSAPSCSSDSASRARLENVTASFTAA